MTDITIYSAATGCPLRRLRATMAPADLPAWAELNCEPTEAWIAGAWDDETHRIVDGAAETIPPRPGAWASFDLASWSWTDPRSAADVAAEAAAALAAARTAAVAQVLGWIAGAAVPLTGGVPLEEMLSWSAKEAAAAAILGGTATPAQTAMIAVEAQLTGEALPALCETILAKAMVYHSAVGVIAGLRRSVEAAVAEAATPAECEAIAAAAIAQATAVLGA